MNALLTRTKMLAFVCATTLLFGGCISTHTQTRYFAVVPLDEKDPPIEYYRIRIKGTSVNGKSELLTGFYDRDAVRSLYGEMPKRGSSLNSVKDNSSGEYRLVFDPAANNGEGAWELGESDEVYTVIYGVNTDLIADQIKSFAANEENGKAFGRLLGAAVSGDIYLENVELKQQMEGLKSEAEAAAGEIEKQAEAVVDTNAQTTLLAVGSDIVKLYAGAVGATVVVDVQDIDDLKKLIEQLAATLPN